MTDVYAPRSVTLGDLFEFSNGLNTDKSAYGSGTPFANVLEVITHEELDESKIPGRVNVDRAAQNRYSVRHGDVLFNRTSETQGEVGLASTYVGERSVVFGGFVLRGQPKGDVLDIDYSKWALRAPQVRRQIVSRGQGGIRANIGQRDLATVEIEIPSKSEQKAIAAALDDASALISSIERLIAKKRYVKQGLMQELLTGRTRLPSFAGDWTTLRVAAVSHLKARIGWQGLTTEEYRASGSHRLVGGTDFTDGRVNWNTTPYVDKWRYDQDPNIQLRLGDVLITKDGTIGKVALVDRLPGPTTLNSGVFVLRPKQGAYDPTFLFCMLRSRAFEEFVAGLSAGSTINHLYQKDLVTLEFQVPPRIEEQTAIAKVILDVDAELTALDRRLLSARNIKQGMMQQLLSGRTRLVSEIAA